MQLYIDITVTCTCVSDLAFLRPHLGRDVLFVFLYVDFKGSQTNEEHWRNFLPFNFCQNESLTRGLQHTKSSIYAYCV